MRRSGTRPARRTCLQHGGQQVQVPLPRRQVRRRVAPAVPQAGVAAPPQQQLGQRQVAVPAGLRRRQAA